MLTKWDAPFLHRTEGLFDEGGGQPESGAVLVHRGWKAVTLFLREAATALRSGLPREVGWCRWSRTDQATVAMGATDE